MLTQGNTRALCAINGDAAQDNSAAIRKETYPREPGIVTTPIAVLTFGDSPRLAGPSKEHVERLAETDTPLPPILVDRTSMQVIDGTHRLMAAMLNGQTTIDVEFFDGSAADAFLRAVQANVTHGFPLSQADRRVAAERIVASHPYMSDRAIAEAAGLSRVTVAAIRRSVAAVVPPQATRIGKDGRLRPLSSVAGRQKAAAVIAERPQASLREIARESGVSLATASDVRKRLERGEQPMSARAAEAAAQRGAAGPAAAEEARPVRPPAAPPDPTPVIEKLLRDPSLRLSETGRHLLRLLRDNGTGAPEWSGMVAAVPAHCVPLVLRLARLYAQRWADVARQLGERDRAEVAE